MFVLKKRDVHSVRNGGQSISEKEIGRFPTLEAAQNKMWEGYDRLVALFDGVQLSTSLKEMSAYVLYADGNNGLSIETQYEIGEVA